MRYCTVPVGYRATFDAKSDVSRSNVDVTDGRTDGNRILPVSNYIRLTVSARAPALPSLYPFPLLGRGGEGRGNDGGITRSLRYKYDERTEEDISLTGMVA